MGKDDAPQQLNETYTYQPIGNLATKNSLTYSYDATHKHAVSAYNGTTYGYDANGCMTTHGSQAISYDGECHPLRVDLSGQMIGKFAYDGDRARRKRWDATGMIKSRTLRNVRSTRSLRRRNIEERARRRAGAALPHQ